MYNNYMKLSNESELVAYGEKIGHEIYERFFTDSQPVIIELIGDVGVGKTTFTRGLAKGLRIKEPVTSPSFTICKRYGFSLSKPNDDKSETAGILSHYDFYRLDDPGLMSDDLAESINTKNSVVVIEWGESIADILPENHLILRFTLNEDETRTITQTNTGRNTKK